MLASVALQAFGPCTVGCCPLSLVLVVFFFSFRLVLFGRPLFVSVFIQANRLVGISRQPVWALASPGDHTHPGLSTRPGIASARAGTATCHCLL